MSDSDLNDCDIRCPQKCENEKLMSTNSLYEHIKLDCSNTEIDCKDCGVGSKRKFYRKCDPLECIQNLHASLENKEKEITYLKR